MTHALLLIARLGLCAVFAVAGWAKLTDRAGTREAVVAFGAPAALARPLALLVPLAELAAAVLLLPGATAVAGAALALGVLLVFELAIAFNLARGRAPECHCFGQLHSAPAGPRTLVRNAALVAVALATVIGGGGPSAVAWVGGLHGAGLVAVVAGVAIVAVTVAGAVAFAMLLRSYGRVLVRLDRLEQVLGEAGLELPGDAPGLEVIPPQHGLSIGTPAPAFALADVDGVSVSLDDLLASQVPLMLVFASARCGPCAALLPELAAWQREHADWLTVAIAAAGAAGDVRAEAQELALRHVLLDEGAAVHDAFEASGTPSAVLIAVDGTIASHIAAGRDAIESLLHHLLDAPGLPVGSPAPALDLLSIDGEPAALTAGPDVDTLVLFWNPDCGYCRAMHRDLIAWETGVNGSGPRLVVVSSGDPARTREDGFRSTVLLDPGFAAGEAFGAGGTPSAVLLGRDGHVASSIAVGAQAVLGLARTRAPMTGMPA
jgi:thiol-disulfide isomerase/thioredoxin/uncharacterized membrane protein YphA (DoxX/SURF4 family)